MTSVSSNLHKALLPLDGKPILVHILEQLPSTAEIHMAVGYKSDQIKDFFSVYPCSQKISFIDIPHFSGEGSGPGKTLLQCKQHLNSPFLIVCADTLWNEPLDTVLTTNTLFVQTTEESNLSRFCNVTLTENLKFGALRSERIVTGLYDKITPPANTATEVTEQFTGIAFVQDYKDFFNNLESAEPVAGELQIGSGFTSLIAQKKCVAKKLHTWKDAGTPANYFALHKTTPSHFRKMAEEIYFIDNVVVKFFEDSLVCKERIERFKIDADIHPVFLKGGEHFYSFKYTEGSTLKTHMTRKNFESFLNFCTTHVWIQKEEPKNFRDQVLSFYKDKTFARFEQFRSENSDFSGCHELSHFLQNFDWEAVVENAACFRFHGDLQLDNILLHKERFQLIDFRQSFLGTTAYGDLQYDFAKLLTSLLVDFDALITNRQSKSKSIDCADLYCASLRSRVANYDVSFSVIESLVPIVLINMMPLHDKIVSLNIAQAALDRISIQKSQMRALPLPL
ncbi:MAG: phosphotransferase [Bdellovibrionaceae bacterium]|nr:phosphotransferase [Pseudobdellovibrionaceae bacterium]